MISSRSDLPHHGCPCRLARYWQGHGLGPYSAFVRLRDYGSQLIIHVAIGTSLSTIIPTSISSALAHYRKNSLSPALLKKLAFPTLTGAFAGAVMTSIIPGRPLKLTFAVLMVYLGIRMFKKKPGIDASAPLLPHADDPNLKRLLIKPPRFIMSIIAMLCGALGMGGGAFIVPLLQRFELDMRKCVGTSSGLGTLVAIPGTIGHLVAGYANADLPRDNRSRSLDGLASHIPAPSPVHRSVRVSRIKSHASSCGRFLVRCSSSQHSRR